MVSLTSPVVGTAVTGLTSPTYTLASDTAPDASSGKQWVVTAIGGTQTGVAANSLLNPFTVTYTRPKTFKSLSAIDTASAGLVSLPRNEFSLLIRKGSIINSVSGRTVDMFRLSSGISPQSGYYTRNEVKAALSLLSGAIAANLDSLVDSMFDGTL